MMEPLLDKLEREYKRKIKVGKLNVDRNHVVASKYNIEGVPTFILFKDGKEITREVGARSEDQLHMMIESVL
jgi:thioredoxin 1